MNRRLLRILSISAVWVSIATALGADDRLANWRFGKIKVTSIRSGDGRVLRIYASLRNLGEASGEQVRFFLLPAKPEDRLPTPKDQAVADLTERCAKVVSVVFDDTVDVPADLVDSSHLRLFVVVKDQVTDMMPIDGDEAQPEARERVKLQKRIAKTKSR